VLAARRNRRWCLVASLFAEVGWVVVVGDLVAGRSLYRRSGESVEAEGASVPVSARRTGSGGCLEAVAVAWEAAPVSFLLLLLERAFAAHVQAADDRHIPEGQYQVSCLHTVVSLVEFSASQSVRDLVAAVETLFSRLEDSPVRLRPGARRVWRRLRRGPNGNSTKSFRRPVPKPPCHVVSWWSKTHLVWSQTIDSACVDLVVYLDCPALARCTASKARDC
jgi:hypothetical protein